MPLFASVDNNQVRNIEKVFWDNFTAYDSWNTPTMVTSFFLDRAQSPGCKLEYEQGIFIYMQVAGNWWLNRKLGRKKEVEDGKMEDSKTEEWSLWRLWSNGRNYPGPLARVNEISVLV